MKKFFALLIILTMMMGILPAEAAFSQEFYKARDAYAASLNSGNDYTICSAVDKMVSFIPNPSTTEEYQAIIWAVYQGGLAYERIGNYEKAAEYYNKYINYAQYLEKALGEDHSENIKGFRTLLDHMSLRPQLYFESNDPADALYYRAKNENVYGTFSGMGTADGYLDRTSCNTFSKYITFFNEYMSSFSYMIPDNCEYLHYAWNVPNEAYWELESIANGNADSYIIENLQYLATRSEKVLLRFGAEVNVWAAIPADEYQRNVFVETFKKAFIKVASLARIYAPNVAMVYSPNDISNWYVDAGTFYPGDEYVDWIGISCYPNKVTGASGRIGDYADAFYCRGVYENPLMRIKDIVDTFGDRKPIYISECGFAYGYDGVQTIEHALEMCEYFYTYVNMVYPQIKGIIYFNHNREKTFSLETNYELKQKYQETVAENVGIQASLNNTSQGYSKFNTINERLDKITLCTYADYANGMPVSVTYMLDGVAIPSEYVIPYKAVINVDSLGIGKHNITQVITSGSTQETFNYPFYVGQGGMISHSPIEEGAYTNYPAPSVSTSEIKVSVNREYLTFDQPPVAENGRTLVPLRRIFEALRTEVYWDGDTQTVTAYGNNRTIVLTLGSDVMYVNGEAYKLDVPAKAINGRTLVPVRAISEALDCIVDWDGETRTVVIETQY